MKINVLFLVSFLLITSGAFAAGKKIVIIKTSKGEIQLELDSDKAPKTVENFLNYVKSGQYNGTIFHRVIENFMIQGGGFDKSLGEKKTGKAIVNEADNGLSNDVGTIAMARTNDPQSATAQFFINTSDNTRLNFSSKTVDGWGYAVFGRVTKGMDVVNMIKKVKTGHQNGYSDVPLVPIIIKKVIIANSSVKKILP